MEQHISTSGQPEVPRPGWTERLPGLLRAVGALAIVSALYSFLIRGWSGSDDALRYLVLLAHTGGLALIALLSQRWFAESKGPRLLLSLALVSVTTCFAVSGAFLYAAVIGQLQVEIPSVLLWKGLSLQASVGLIFGSLLILVPVSLLGFKVLTRSSSTSMAILFLLSNLVLLIPVRESAFTAGMTIVIGLALLIQTISISRHHIAIKTQEGLIAVTLLFLPVALMSARTWWLYDSDAMTWCSMCLLSFVIARSISQLFPVTSSARLILEVASVWAAVVAGLNLFVVLQNLGVNYHASIVVGSWVAAGLIFELSLRAAKFIAGYRFIVATVLSLCALIAAWDQVMNAGLLLNILLGAGLIVLSVKYRSQSIFRSGIIVVAISLGSIALNLLSHFYLGHWLVLALMGVIAIVSASMMESRGRVTNDYLRGCLEEYRTWNL